MSKSKLYTGGSNEWQNNRYAFMSKFNRANGITSFGRAKKNGEVYDHIIDSTKEKEIYNLLEEKEILKEVNERFATKAGDKERVLNNTVASQPCCFNLFAPLKNRLDLASKLFSRILNKEFLKVTSIDIEFTPTAIESIGDQSALGGTDADVAVFYEYDKCKTGVLLIEFKYIEAEFSICSSYKNKNGKIENGLIKKNIRPICDSQTFYKDLIDSNLVSDKKQFDCGYLKFENWHLLSTSKAFDFDKIKSSIACPFRFSLNQLWRNMLLAEKVAAVRGLDDFRFCVLSPIENKWLWSDAKENAYDSFKNILSHTGSEKFFKVELDKEFVQLLDIFVEDKWCKEWLSKFRTKYLTDTF
ncbi:MAG: hypothetical protein K9H41_05875 [Bacteroidia bacterium]|nr:hypothetical protein [Bacteroidia bacterium]